MDRVGHADDASLEDSGMMIQGLFHFLRRDVGAAANDDLLDAPFEPEETVRIAPDQVAGAQPAVVKGGRGGLRVVPISHAIGRALYLQFADLAVGHNVTGRDPPRGCPPGPTRGRSSPSAARLREYT